MRIDRLDLSLTDIDTNQNEQSLNLLNYRVDGTQYHYPATSAKICYHVVTETTSDTYTTYYAPMVFITDDGVNPTETTFLMGAFEVRTSDSTLYTPLPTNPYVMTNNNNYEEILGVQIKNDGNGSYD